MCLCIIVRILGYSRSNSIAFFYFSCAIPWLLGCSFFSLFVLQCLLLQSLCLLIKYWLLIYYIFILLIIYILNCLLCHTLQQLYIPFSALFGSLLSFSQVVFPTPLLLKRLFLFLRSCFFSLCFALFLVCPLGLICSVIRFFLGFLSFQYLLFCPLNMLINSFIYIYLFI